MKKISLKADGKLLTTECFVARGFFDRFRGLMLRKSLPEDEVIFFPRCNSIHTFFMRFPIDVAFVGSDGRVVEVLVNLRPWRMLVPRRLAEHAFEFAPRRTKSLGLRVGQKLDWETID